MNDLHRLDHQRLATALSHTAARARRDPDRKILGRLSDIRREIETPQR